MEGSYGLLLCVIKSSRNGLGQAVENGGSDKRRMSSSEPTGKPSAFRNRESFSFSSSFPRKYARRASSVSKDRPRHLVPPGCAASFETSSDFWFFMFRVFINCVHRVS